MTDPIANSASSKLTDSTEQSLPDAELSESGVTESELPLSERRLPFLFARRHGVILTHRDSDNAFVSYRKDASSIGLREIQRFVGKPLSLKQIDDEAFESILAEVYHTDASDAMQAMEGIGDEFDLFRIAEELPETEDLLESEDDAPIIRLINALLTEAIKENASDIHIETFEKHLVVRFRIDGVLREVLQPNRKLAPLLVSRIKVMAKLDIAEKRIPQDGRIALRIANRAVDVRVSTMPSSFGERVVLRLLDKQAGRLDFGKLGMDGDLEEQLKALLFKPHGILLVTGPTGSGKTTTLYAGITLLNSNERNILTVEDPIEYQLDGIGQTQVNTKVDMTFARGLRAILRQDPDVVMVGEIRDLETAQIAVQASLTGHLVLSTLHTNTAVGAITRLQDMGVEPFLLSSSILGVLAQRLVRQLCPTCKLSHTANEQEIRLLSLESSPAPTIYSAKGCEECNFQGYRGRTGIYDLMIVNEEIREAMHNNEAESVIEKMARQHSPSIRSNGREQVLKGNTTVEEILRVTRED